MNWQETAAELLALCVATVVTDHAGNTLSADMGFRRWLDFALTVRQKGQYLYLIGNGASSSMASHFATDITKNGKVKTHVFTDSSLLSAVGNDYCFAELYARPLAWYGKKGDLLVAISSSGKSANILAAGKKARELGLNLITLSAMQPDNPLRSLGDLNFYLAANTYGFAESGHAIILHHWMDLLESSAGDSMHGNADDERY